MELQRQLERQPRKIVGFHLDDKLDWVKSADISSTSGIIRRGPTAIGSRGVGRRTSAMSCVV
jgi:hypothetical protein